MHSLRVSVPLDDEEATALISMAEEECRHQREQLRFLLRTEANRRGILPYATEARDVLSLDTERTCGQSEARGGNCWIGCCCE